ncbi:hypothetical protein ACHAQH_005134 [Verticillium albo-atrum]
MARSPVWHQLPASASHDVPDLLVSTEFTADSYIVRISDMANMWVEEMDRRAIYKRSLAEDTSIDPTDSPQNMQAFLSRIHSAFDASHEDHEDSRLGLSVADGNVLTLKITCEVPELQPLVWPMSFNKCTPSQVGTKLVLPLLQTNLARIRQVNTLLEIIQQKDAVMTKLLDKLESTGTRLENIFTTLSAKQKVSRQTAETKVKGLAPFKPYEWRDQLATDDETPRNVTTLLKAVFEAHTPQTASELNSCDSPALDDWWTKLSAGHVIPMVGPEKTPSCKEQTPPSKPTEPDDGDDFQVQSTPPHLSSARKRAAGKEPQPPAADDESTEDEDEHKSPKLTHHSQAPRKKIESVRLGAIGSKKRTTTPPPPPSPGSETESDNAEDNHIASLPPSSPPHVPSSQLPSVTVKKKGLGHIGKSKLPESDAPQSSEIETNSTEKKPIARKLGQIGRKAAVSGSTNATAGSRGRTAERTEEVEPRETSEDRANKKREELQKELQRKATAGPARKKRKF